MGKLCTHSHFGYSELNKRKAGKVTMGHRHLVENNGSLLPVFTSKSTAVQLPRNHDHLQRKYDTCFPLILLPGTLVTYILLCTRLSDITINTNYTSHT